MQSIFPPLDSCFILLLQEAYDVNGRHLEYRDPQGALFARMTKVYKRSQFSALFDVFRGPQDIHAELRDASDTLLLTTLARHGAKNQDLRAEIHHPDGGLFGVVRDAPFGVDFTGPGDRVVGAARRPDDGAPTTREVVYTYNDAAGQVVGTCARSYPAKTHWLWDFMEGNSKLIGQPMDTVTIDAVVEPELRTFLLLFPALQHVRYSQSG